MTQHIEAFNVRDRDAEPWAAGAPTGKAVELRWASAYEVNGAALTSEHLYFDQMDLLSQLGLLPD